MAGGRISPFIFAFVIDSFWIYFVVRRVRRGSFAWPKDENDPRNYTN